MKIKRFNNLWLMGLILSASILGVIYLFKLCFPEFVIEIAQIDSITRIGHYIDTHKWAWYLASSILSFIIYYFLCCASSGRKNLTINETIVVTLIYCFGYVIREFSNEYYTTYNFISMIICPCICKGKMFNTTICVSALMILQSITLSIRNLVTMISDLNFATLIILMIDYYILAFLLYQFFNFKKEN